MLFRNINLTKAQQTVPVTVGQGFVPAGIQGQHNMAPRNADPAASIKGCDDPQGVPGF